MAAAITIGVLCLAPGAWSQQTPPQAAPAPAGTYNYIDPQITHVVYRTGHNSVDAAKLAMQKSQNPDVRAFADKSIRDLIPIDNDIATLEKKLNIHPEDSPLEESMSVDAKNATQRLTGLSGKEFDKAYVENAVAVYRQINAALRDTLMPAARNPEIKDLVQNAASVFQRLQRDAEQLASKLGTAG